MAAEQGTPFAGSGEPSPEEMNGVAQLLAWFLIKHKFYNRQRYTKWHTAFYAVWESVSGVMTRETCHLLTLASLLVKVHSDQETTRASLKRIVTLLERAILFRELAELRGALQVLLDEAKCQAVLQCWTADSPANKDGSTLFDEYFGSKQDSIDSEVGQELHRLLKGSENKDNTADMERFLAKHSLSQFTEVLREFLTSAVTHLTSYHVYNNFYDHVKAHCSNYPTFTAVINGRVVQSGKEELAYEEGGGREEMETDGDRDGDRVGEEVQGVVQETQEERKGSEGGEREEEEEEEKEEEDDKEEDDEEEGEEYRGSEEELIDHENEEVLEDDSDFEYMTPSKRPRGQKIHWDSSSDLTDVATPPSRLPERDQRGFVIRSRNSLMNSSPLKNVWSVKETEQLLKGVKQFGPGKWKKILDHYDFAPHRTSVSLKDKWRNLQGRKK